MGRYSSLAPLRDPPRRGGWTSGGRGPEAEPQGVRPPGTILTQPIVILLLLLARRSSGDVGMDVCDKDSCPGGDYILVGEPDTAHA